MANFTNSQKASILYAIVADLESREAVTDVPYTRPQLWAASQAVRDLIDAGTFRTAVSDAIDAAIAPATMTNARKKRLFGRVVEAMVPLEVV